MIDDPEILAMQKAQRKKKLTTIGIVVGVLVVGALGVFPMGSSVQSALEADGYSNVEVKRDGAFSFTFTAKKGDSSCSGSVTKMPGSTSSSEFCTAVSKK